MNVVAVRLNLMNSFWPYHMMVVTDGYAQTLDVVNSKEKDLDFSSQLLVLDFFTYCCINCMHILPDLEVIEQTFGDKVKVIGIHSAKFENEKSTENILKAVERYNIAHPVLNDKDCLIWNKLHIKCWPTIVVFGRGLKPLICCSGEGYRDIIIQTIEAALEIFGSISVNPTTIVLPRRNPNQLYYPGKIALSNDELLVVSDTGNNRIVICDFEGNVKNIVGCGFRGYLDGPKDIARFNGPQGVCVLLDGSILVADTGNHRIRMLFSSADSGAVEHNRGLFN
ncbi:hypothetical protein QYM36_011603 [Artemia franciscana]|uniref:Thioredoxin-like fold domain-containing protein n=1 Tax=Artemia franciscana TaxID=6661 RepID=A0AA88HME7_ARTSF|nr:hypothetical protein QYM36_011603 [Artemia franciscana]